MTFLSRRLHLKKLTAICGVAAAALGATATTASATDASGSFSYAGKTRGQFQWDDYGDRVRVRDVAADTFAVRAYVVADAWGPLGGPPPGNPGCTSHWAVESNWTAWCDYSSTPEGRRVKIFLEVFDKRGVVVASSGFWTAST